MSATRTSAAFLAVAALIAGCPASNTPQAPGKTPTPTAVKPTGTTPVKATTSLEGSVKAPSTMVAAGAGNVLSHNGGAIVAAGAGNMVAAGAGNWKLLAIQEGALANAEVFLADSTGKPIAGVKSVATGKDGTYKLEGVPATGTFTIQVRVKTDKGKETTLSTLVQPGNGAADVSAATTCVAVALLGETGKEFGAFDAAKFRQAVAATEAELTPETLPDLADRAATFKWMQGLSARVEALGKALDDLGKQLAQKLEALGNQLAQNAEEARKQAEEAARQAEALRKQAEANNAALSAQIGAIGGQLGELAKQGQATPAPIATPLATPKPKPTLGPAPAGFPTPDPAYTGAPVAVTIGPEAPLADEGKQLVPLATYVGRIKYENRTDPKGAPVAFRIVADPRTTDSKRNAADLSFVAKVEDTVTFTVRNVELPARYRMHADFGSDPAKVGTAKDAPNQLGYIKVELKDGKPYVNYDWEPDAEDGRLEGISFDDVK